MVYFVLGEGICYIFILINVAANSFSSALEQLLRSVLAGSCRRVAVILRCISPTTPHSLKYKSIKNTINRVSTLHEIYYARGSLPGAKTKKHPVVVHLCRSFEGNIHSSKWNWEIVSPTNENILEASSFSSPICLDFSWLCLLKIEKIMKFKPYYISLGMFLISSFTNDTIPERNMNKVISTKYV